MTLSKALCIPKGAGDFVMTPVVLQKQHEHVLRLPNKYMVHLGLPTKKGFFFRVLQLFGENVKKVNQKSSPTNGGVESHGFPWYSYNP